jgi:hypothetical protein
MPVTSVAELIAQLNTAVDSLEIRYRVGEVKAGDVESLKSAVDDARLRLWALLNTGTGEDGRAFEERHRIRRAKELCGRISTQVRSGAILADSELTELSAVTSDLARAIDSVKG